ncbi:hypothetical protein F0261_04155 [Alteromonas sp. 07-89-2]|uniref:hypothetical protein n=1 Tax=Alteromonas sp. 07-89-2 TaxID=2607609 RepID=UPI00148CDA2E|nr:hypothetical protein [Alteromonas sp. 07-89-2]NOH57232.1 hypothetical protein [Alteromonas sp. 07-89-2]
MNNIYKYTPKNSSQELYIKNLDGESSLTVVSESGEIETILELIPAMLHNKVIQLDQSADAVFIDNISHIQEIYSQWDERLKRVPLKANTCITKGTGKYVASFFTGGVDSFYTFLKNKREITHLVFVHGYDVALNDSTLRNEVSKRLKVIAAEFDTEVIELESNARTYLEKHVLWGPIAHGLALSIVMHSLSSHFKKFFIPSTHTYSELFPWGSHPILDHLWGTSNMRVVHDGCEASRVEKVEKISNYQVALDNLRVCWENPSSQYNCGRCEKCIRTKINLHACNALDKCNAFDVRELEYELIRQLEITDENSRSFIRQNLTYIKKNNPDKKLEKALTHVLERWNILYKFKQLVPKQTKDKLKARFSYIKDISSR